MGFELFLFLALGFVAIIAAAGMIISNNAVHSALFLIANFGCVALLYLMLDAPFLSMVQIAVYAGAIMVLFLFVIMLLGAEQATDNDRSLRWVTTAATVLGASLLFAVAIPFVLSGGVDLPEPPQADPMVRVVHAANVDADTPVTVTVAGESLDEPVVIDNFIFGDVAPAEGFLTLPAGEYMVSLAANDSTVYEAPVTFAGDDIVTVVAYGDDPTNIDLAVLPNSFATSGENQARIVIANLFSEAPLYVVEKGRNQRLDVDTETNDINDATLVAGAALGEGNVVNFREGTANFGIYQLLNGEYQEITPVDDYEVEAGQEHMMLLIADYAATPDISGNVRMRVLYRNAGTLDIETLESFGSPGDIGRQLFTVYLLPVNLVGFLLLVALIGVIVLTRPEGIQKEGRSTRNRRRKVARPLVGVISQQTGRDVVVDTPRLDDGSGD